MVLSSTVCPSCSSHNVPKDANFCPSCGKRVQGSESAAIAHTNDDEAVPMVDAVPVEETTDQNLPSVRGVSTTAESIPLEASTVTFDEEYHLNNNNDNNNNHHPSSSSSAGNIPYDTNQQRAMYWKNPTPAMLKHAAEYEVMGGILFIRSGDKGRAGKFIVPKSIHVGHILTGTHLDLSLADFVYPTTTITIGTVLGGCKIMVPPGVRVETSRGFSILGGFKGLGSQTVNASQCDDSPLLVVQGMAILGGAKVEVNPNVPPIQVVP